MIGADFMQEWVAGGPLVTQEGTSRPSILLSAPADSEGCDGALFPAEDYQGFQALFGFDGQLRCFASALQQCGVRALVTPAPELFFTEQSLRWLDTQVGCGSGTGAASRRLLHVRFGPLRLARVVRGLSNIQAVAEAGAGRAIPLGRHPYAAGNRVLPSMRAALLYGEHPVPARKLNDGKLDVFRLPEAFLAADLTTAPDVVGKSGRSLAELRSVPGLQMQSFAEFDPHYWTTGSSAQSPRPSADFRRSLIEQANSAGMQQEMRPLILLPWNLAHPGSIVPDLVMKFARFAPAAPVQLAVFPYNATHGADGALAQLVDRVRHGQGLNHRGTAEETALLRARLQRLFLCRLTNLVGLEALPRLCAMAWVDGGDPEAAWTLQRLNWCGIPSALIEQEDAQLAASVASLAEIRRTALEPLAQEVRDAFGRRLVWSATLSVNDFLKLVNYAAELAIRTGRAARRLQADSQDEVAAFVRDLLMYV
jgi:hypothetical protein